MELMENGGVGFESVYLSGLRASTDYWSDVIRLLRVGSLLTESTTFQISQTTSYHIKMYVNMYVCMCMYMHPIHYASTT